MPSSANPQPVLTRPSSPVLTHLLPTNDLGEFPTATPWCQRWRERRHSFRHTSAGGFDPRHYIVEPLAVRTAKEFVLQHHYSGSFPSAKKTFGLFNISEGEPRLSGVAVFGLSVSRAVLERALPHLEPNVAALECSRFVLLDECPANAESWFLARTFDALLASDVRGVVSFADPVPRRTNAGKLVAVGHAGTIYQASNAAYTGRATARTIKLLPDGTVLNDRSAQKVRKQEQGHEYVEAKLMSLGAPAPRAGCDPALWLRDALHAVGARNLRHRGAHRYVFRLGKNQRERDRITLGYPDLKPYPKGPDSGD
ncbi:Mom family adenine methylcarbamoylation protein [[Kitasatospora] papulosa]|uniref:Mom family adenine methylcarbamoylation protein n=1 Tax=[Kitasatospora] papulosa TaxID=1464011 RepID=UPI0036282E22